MKKVIALALVALLGVGCSGAQEESAAVPETEQMAAVEAPTSTPERPIVVIDTDSGSIVTEFYPDIAPVTSDSILSLVNQGFYNGLTFHRIIPGFVIQGGDPQGNGTGNAGFTLPAEFSDRPHVEGTLSMARRGDDVNSASCQFFICLSTLGNLDSLYTVFGHVIQGLDVVHKLESVPTGEGDMPLEPVIIRRMYENR